jgi:opacity protein-like surface antigen
VRTDWKKSVVACALLAAPAAQAAKVVEPRLRLTVEERFDDDLRLGGADATGGQLMTKLSPRLGVDVKDERLTLESFYASDVLARHGSGKVTLDHRGGLDVARVLSRRLKLDAGGRVFRVTDPTSLPRDGLARSASPTFYAQAHVGMTGRLTERLDLRAGYAFEATRIIEPGRLAGYAHTPSVELWYRSTRRLSLGLEYRYQGFVYDKQYSQAHGATVGLRYRLTRPTTLRVSGGPVRYLPPSGEQGGWAPRVKLELAREGEAFDVAVGVGHDLVGASGFSSALWADYASAVLAHRFTGKLSAFGAGSFFRNGKAPGVAYGEWRNTTRVAQGYALGGGVEYRVDRKLSFQGAVDRIAQVGAGGAAGAVDLTRNVMAVRLNYTAW